MINHWHHISVCSIYWGRDKSLDNFFSARMLFHWRRAKHAVGHPFMLGNRTSSFPQILNCPLSWLVLERGWLLSGGSCRLLLLHLFLYTEFIFTNHSYKTILVYINPLLHFNFISAGKVSSERIWCWIRTLHIVLWVQEQENGKNDAWWMLYSFESIMSFYINCCYSLSLGLHLRGWAEQLCRNWCTFWADCCILTWGAL